MADEALRRLARGRVAGSREDLLSLLRRLERAGDWGALQDSYFSLCRAESAGAHQYLTWRISTGALTQERLELAALCGHEPAALVSWRAYRSRSSISEWLADLRRPLIGSASGPAARLALVATIEWILDVQPDATWRRVADSLWSVWRSLSLETLNRETRPLVRSAPLSTARDTALWALTTMVSQHRTYQAGVEREICDAITALQLEEAQLLRQVRGLIALWALELDSEASWLTPRQLGQDVLQALLGPQSAA